MTFHLIANITWLRYQKYQNTRNNWYRITVFIYFTSSNILQVYKNLRSVNNSETSSMLERRIKLVDFKVRSSTIAKKTRVFCPETILISVISIIVIQGVHKVSLQFQKFIIYITKANEKTHKWKLLQNETSVLKSFCASFNENLKWRSEIVNQIIHACSLNLSRPKTSLMFHV